MPKVQKNEKEDSDLRMWRDLFIEAHNEHYKEIEELKKSTYNELNKIRKKIRKSEDYTDKDIIRVYDRVEKLEAEKIKIMHRITEMENRNIRKEILASDELDERTHQLIDIYTGFWDSELKTHIEFLKQK